MSEQNKGQPQARRPRPSVTFLDGEVSSFKNKKGDLHHHPHVGGRLRNAHDFEETISIETRIHQFESRQVAVVQAKVTLSFGVFGGTGTANAARDRDKIDALLELAETRAIGRALRWAGYGVEMAGAEEMERLEGGPGAGDPTRALCTPEQTKEVFLLFALLDIPPAAQQAGLAQDGVTKVQELTQQQAINLITKLKAKRDGKPA